MTEKEVKAEEQVPKEQPVSVEETTEAPAEATEAEPEKFAKSGKKSKKHIEEVKAEEERQAHDKRDDPHEAASRYHEPDADHCAEEIKDDCCKRIDKV